MSPRASDPRRLLGTARLTMKGSEALEATIRDALVAAAAAIARAVDPSEYVALVLHGGYGRGEGGVDRSTGEERPHNNFDLLLITSHGSKPDALRPRVDQAVRPVAASTGIGIDVGLIAARALAAAPHLVMWHDMHRGHRTLLGDPRFVPSLRRFAGDDIEPADVRNLLTNRASLLVIAEAAIASGPSTVSPAMDSNDAKARSVVKHVMKAIIGYGDAYLFFRGRYDASYAEKQRRMRALADADPTLRALYDEALAFRFEPTYTATLAAHPDLGAWVRQVAETFAPIHLECERRRLQDAKLEWPAYLDTAFSHAPLEGPWTARATVAGMLRLAGLRGRRISLPNAPMSARLGSRFVDARGWLSILLPTVLYDLDATTRARAARLLGASSTSRPALQRAYLRAWGRDGDPNFAPVARKLGLRLDEAQGGPA